MILKTEEPIKIPIIEFLIKLTNYEIEDTNTFGIIYPDNQNKVTDYRSNNDENIGKIETINETIYTDIKNMISILKDHITKKDILKLQYVNKISI